MRRWLSPGLQTLRSELLLLWQLLGRLWANRRFRRSFLAALGLLLALALLYALLSWLIGGQLIRSARLPLPATPSRPDVRYQDVAFAAHDGLALKGWLVSPQPERARRLVILVHDAEQGRAAPGLLPLIDGLARAGFAVLTYDGRGHGESAGESYTLSYGERFDLQGALAFAAQQGFAPEATGVLGLGMGGATTLLAAAEMPQVGALAVDSTFASLGDMVRARLRQQHLPESLLWGVRWAVKLRGGPDLGHIVPEAAVARMAPRPLLVIHGLDDQELSPDHARRLVDAAGPGSVTELWIVPDAGHLEALARHEQEYLARVTGFFERSLRSSP